MLGGFYFFGMIVFISTLGLHEYYTLAEKRGASPQIALGLIFGFLVSCVFIWEKMHYHVILPLSVTLGLKPPMLRMEQVLLLLFLLFVPLIMLLELFRNKGSAITNLATTLFGVCYVSLFLGSFVGVRELFVAENIPGVLYAGSLTTSVPGEVTERVYSWGGATVITIFTSIWMCDSLAYFAGRFFGRHKLFERVSPKKTWEGASAGYVGAVAAFLIAQNCFLPYMSVGTAFVCGSIVGIFGQLGDLVESLLKRDAQVKDSSAIIPGHGGVLDRFDSLIFVSPPILFYLEFIVF